MTTFLLLLWLIPIAVNVYLDRNGRKPNYIAVNTARSAAAVVHAILMSWNYGITLEVFSKWENALPIVPILIFQVTSYWIIFELALNIIRGKELLYYDRFEKDSGSVDRFFAWGGRELHFICKIKALVFMILSIILIYMKS